MVAHAHVQLPIVVLKLSALLHGTGKLCYKFGEHRSISDVTILSTDAGRTDGRRLRHWTDSKITNVQNCCLYTS